MHVINDFQSLRFPENLAGGGILPWSTLGTEGAFDSFDSCDLELKSFNVSFGGHILGGISVEIIDNLVGFFHLGLSAVFQASQIHSEGV